MSRFLPVGVALCVILYAANALGGEKQCVEGNPDHCVQPLEEGEPAPFFGQLYTPELAIDHSEKVHSFDQRLRLEIGRVRDRLEIKIEGCQRRREIDADAATKIAVVHQKALDAAYPSWYEHPAFVIPMTAVAVAVIILGVFAVAAEYKNLWVPATP